MLRALLLAAIATIALCSDARAAGCATSDNVVLQVLGSGGPAINSTRASAGYLLWVGDKARIVVDLGGGTFLRFGQSGAQMSDLSLLAITHLHPDHVSDLPAFLWRSQTIRPAPLPVAGPSGAAPIPDVRTFLTRLFDQMSGVFPQMAPAVGAPQGPLGGSTPLSPVTVVDASQPAPTVVLDRDGLTVSAVGIPHGMPTLAYRVAIGSTTVVFSSDQNGTDPRFAEFARDADLLVLHMAIAAGASTPIHASPATVGEMAARARTRHLVVSHLGAYDMDAAVADVRRAYKGPLTVAEDLACVPAR